MDSGVSQGRNLLGFMSARAEETTAEGKSIYFHGSKRNIGAGYRRFGGSSLNLDNMK